MNFLTKVNIYCIIKRKFLANRVEASEVQSYGTLENRDWQ